MNILNLLSKAITQHSIIHLDCSGDITESQFSFSLESVSGPQLLAKSEVENKFKELLKHFVNSQHSNGLDSLLNIDNISFLENVNYHRNHSVSEITKSLRKCDIIYCSLFVGGGAYLKNFGGFQPLYNKLEKIQLKNQKNKCLFFQDSSRQNPYENIPVLLFTSCGIHFAGKIDEKPCDLYYKLENNEFVESSLHGIYNTVSGKRLFLKDYP